MGPLRFRGWRALRTCTAFTTCGAAAFNIDCGSGGDCACRVHFRWDAGLNGNSGSIGSFVRNLFGSMSEDETRMTHNEAPVEPSAPKRKPATSKPELTAVATAPAHPAKLRSQPANTKTATGVTKPSAVTDATGECRAAEPARERHASLA